MHKDTALYVGNDYADQKWLDGHLQSLGIDLHRASSAPVARQKICKHKYNLLLIQFEPIQYEIFDFCKFTRNQHYEAIVIVLTPTIIPHIESKLFDCGVDDIAAGEQTLPISLISRIKRRLTGRLSVPKTDKIMLKGGAIVDTQRREVSLNGSNNKLKGVQYKLFRYFLENPHRVISKHELLQSHIWKGAICSPNKQEQGRAISMTVTRLRKLIEPDPSNPQIIITVHGTGWILAKDAIP